MNLSHRTYPLIATLILAATAATANAQAQPNPAPANPPQFEAVSIRPSGPQSRGGWDGGPGTDSPTLFRFRTARLENLIDKAWNVDTFQIVSATPLDPQPYDIEARLPQGATDEQFRAMLQNMLATRFALKVHLDQKEFPVYQLVVAPSGLKLKEAVAGQPDEFQGADSSGPCGEAGWPDLPPNIPNAVLTERLKVGYKLNCMTAQREPFAALAHFLRKQDNLPIIDKTGLTGPYSFHLEYAAEAPDAGADVTTVAVDLFTALKDQLGLQLQKTKLPLKVVVVDAVNKQPTAN
ncbi:MAG TPA: TIGR03435 family protein [Acidobacteriaceae bacterium]|nr:TIGR03435 family protein [Acidobacteriaceae bacterium]